jgi:lipopolysaccharide export system protein LptC
MNPRLYDRIAAGMSLLLLSLLALGTWYLAERSMQADIGPAAGSVKHERDYFVERFELIRLNNQGRPLYRMTAKRLDHFADDDSTEYEEPRLVSLDTTRPRMTLSANQGRSTREAEQTHLYGAVRLTRAATDKRPEMRMDSDYVLVLAEQEIARTDRPVRITSGASWLTGVGMEFDNRTQRLDLLSQVRGTWISERTTKPEP